MKQKRFVLTLIMLAYLFVCSPVFAEGSNEKSYCYTMYENTFDSGRNSMEAFENEYLVYDGLSGLEKPSAIKTAYNGENTGIRVGENDWCWDRTFLFDFTKKGDLEGLKSGIITVSFDYSMDAASSADHAIIGMNMTDSYSGRRMMYIKSGSYCVLDNIGEWPKEYTDGISYNVIHNLKIVMNFDDNTAKYYLDSENIKTQDITGVIMNNLAISLSGIIGFFDNLKITAEYTNPVEIVASTDNFGNNFFERENIKFKIEARSRANEPVSETATINIKNSAGDVVFTKSQKFDLEAKEYMSVDLDVTLPEFDSYILTIDSENSIGFSTRFARSVKAEKNNEKINTNGHLDGRYNGINIPGLFRMMENAGYGALRTQYPWKQDENGNFIVHEDEEWYRQTLEESARYGIDLIALMNVKTGITDADGGFNTDTTFLTRFKSWCEWMADRYKGKISWFELGNEDNYTKKANGTPDSGADYYKILKAGYEGIKDGNPDAVVITSGSQVLYTDTERNQRQFAEGMLGSMKAENNYSFDVFGVHPYHVAHAPEVRDIWSENTSWLEQCEVLNDLFSKYEVTGKQKWATEMGYYTTIENEKQQAQRLIRMFALNEVFSYHDKMFVFDIMDNGLDKTDSEHNYGSLCYYLDRDWHDRSAYSAKALYIATAQWNKMLAGANLIDYTKNDNLYVVNFEQDNKKISVIWDADNKNEEIKLSDKRENISVYDMYGNLKQTAYEEISIIPSSEPCYVEFMYGERVLYENSFDNGPEDFDILSNNYVTVKVDKSYEMKTTELGGIALEDDKPSDKQTFLFDFTCGGKTSGLLSGTYKISYEFLINAQSKQQCFTGINMSDHYQGGRSVYMSKDGYCVMPYISAWSGEYIMPEDIVKLDMEINLDENKIDYYINGQYCKTQENLLQFKPVKNYSIALGGAIAHIDNIKISELNPKPQDISALISMGSNDITLKLDNNSDCAMTPVMVIAEDDEQGRMVGAEIINIEPISQGNYFEGEYDISDKEGIVRVMLLKDLKSLVPVCNMVCR